MAKQLKDILKQAHDTIKGVRPSETSPESLGKDPGVDYDPKAGDEREFIAKHSVQKWDDPNGNKDDVFNATNVKYSLDRSNEKRHGNTETKAKQAAFAPVKESATKKAEDTKCNMSEAGAWCPMHEMASCKESMNLKEGYLNFRFVEPGDKKGVHDFAGDKRPGTKTLGKEPKDKAKNSFPDKTGESPADRKARFEEVEQVDELSTATLKSYKEKQLTSKDKSPTQSKNRLIGFARASRKIDAKEKQPVEEGKYNWDKEHKRGMTDTQGNRMLRKKSLPPSGPSKEELRKLSAKATHVGAKVSEQTVIEKHLTPAEMKKREEIAQAIHRKTPSMPMGKKMAIATATAKKVAEDLAVPLLGGADSDESAEMAKSQLKALANKAMHLVTQIPDSMMIEPWVQAKIANAKLYVNDVHDYMLYGDHDKEPENETMDTPLTLPNMSVDVNTGQNV